MCGILCCSALHNTSYISKNCSILKSINVASGVLRYGKLIYGWTESLQLTIIMVCFFPHTLYIGPIIYTKREKRKLKHFNYFVFEEEKFWILKGSIFKIHTLGWNSHHHILYSYIIVGGIHYYLVLLVYINCFLGVRRRGEVGLYAASKQRSSGYIYVIFFIANII